MYPTFLLKPKKQLRLSQPSRMLSFFASLRQMIVKIAE
ncbi:hypothetical protein B4168_1926 [Anoxybacillus flavithermus]|nr:hypothetical protein B4168_1926 [Anoxybacillus flavithermus]OAO85583.1 hypothetical protein GT23_2486 [Parageobacillus thermoglucosidasius]